MHLHKIWKQLHLPATAAGFVQPYLFGVVGSWPCRYSLELHGIVCSFLQQVCGNMLTAIAFHGPHCSLLPQLQEESPYPDTLCGKLLPYLLGLCLKCRWSPQSTITLECCVLIVSFSTWIPRPSTSTGGTWTSTNPAAAKACFSCLRKSELLSMWGFRSIRDMF